MYVATVKVLLNVWAELCVTIGVAKGCVCSLRTGMM